MTNIKHKSLRVIKQIIITQILSVIFAIVGELYMRLLITYDWLLKNVILLNLVIILLMLLYVIAIKLFVEGNWLNVILISLPYVVYWFIILLEGTKIFPTYTDPNDYGIGIIGIVISIYQWISVITASVIGTYLKKRRYRIKNNL